MEGTPFGRYRLIELLGRGGMGEVWRSFDTATERVVALKLLPENFADDRTFQERFRREARAAAGLDEPHVVPIYDFGEIDGRLYVSMRLIEGRDLLALLDGLPLEPARSVTIVEQIASALQAAHRVRLVHRDVKPSNILIAEDDFAYLIDFGIARAAGDTQVTSTGATVGTWAYMAPERFQMGIADARADIYALACVLYQSLTGQLPFPANSLEQAAAAHLFAQPPRPSALRGGVSLQMDHVIATGMAKDPDRRYASTKDLARAARAALTAPMSPPTPPLRATEQPVSTKPAPKQNRIPPRTLAPAAVTSSPLKKSQLHPGASDQKPRSGRRRSIALASFLMLLLAGGAILTSVLLTHRGSPKVSQEGQVRQTIRDFDTAIQKGDLAQLRDITCGTTRDRYVKYRDQDWVATYPRIAAAKAYPVVASIDQVVVNDQHAEANVTSFMAYAPQVRSTRSFDLQYLDGRWKICEGPIS